MKKQVNKKNKKNISKEMYKAVPEDVKIAFGKFYVFSFIYLIFFLLLYPFLLIKTLSDFCLGIVFGFLLIFYIYIIRDTRKKIKTFSSNLYYFLIVCVFLSMSFSIIKYFI